MTYRIAFPILALLIAAGCSDGMQAVPTRVQRWQLSERRAATKNGATPGVAEGLTGRRNARRTRASPVASATRVTETTGTEIGSRGGPLAASQANRRQTGLGSAIRWRVGVNLPFSGSRPNTTTQSDR